MAYYLVQHGKAHAKENDPEQGLTEEGIQETLKIGQLLLSKTSNINMICHSGKKRAEQTASIFGEQLGLENKVKPIDGIQPMDDVECFAGLLVKNTLIVSHLPFLEKLTNYLVSHNADMKPNVVDYSNSHVVCLEKNALGGFQIAWIL